MCLAIKPNGDYCQNPSKLRSGHCLRHIGWERIGDDFETVTFPESDFWLETSTQQTRNEATMLDHMAGRATTEYPDESDDGDFDFYRAEEVMQPRHLQNLLEAEEAYREAGEIMAFQMGLPDDEDED